MYMMTRERIPARVSPPGIIIQHEIDARGWTQKDLAEIINRPVQAINEIIKGTKQITPETAIELGAAFGSSPQMWLNLETNYRLWLASQKKDGTGIVKRGRLYSLLPVREMQRRGWLGPVGSTAELECAICEFLAIENLDDEPKTVNFRCSPGKEPDLPSKMAWVNRVKYLASRKKVGPFDAQRLEKQLPEILSLSTNVENIRNMPVLLSDLGIRFVIVPTLPKTYIDGAAFYVNDSPTIALSLRYDRIDSFWFNICHEISHILYGHNESYLDVNLYEVEASEESVSSKEEVEANEQAKNWLIDPTVYHAFINSVQGRYFSREAIEDFARSLKRHPGIILGRLQRDGYVPYRNLRQLLVKLNGYLEGQIDC
jgi:HTH-type transcriptional regulator/antitoxin HigA